MHRRFLLLSLLLTACAPQSSLQTSTSTKVAKNVVLMIGDGMGLSQISGAVYTSKRALSLESMPVVGLQKTHCKDKLVTDSAAAAAAIARGVKANYNGFGTTETQRAPQSILEYLEESGWATGMVVTSSITHATPAAFVTYQVNRSMNEEIASDFLNIEIDYLVGGGKKYFDRREIDNRDLIKEMQAKNTVVRTYLDGEIADVDIPPSSNFVYFSADSEPISHQQGRKYLSTATDRAISFLRKRSENGFFLLIEGSQIDWGGHANLGDFVVEELLDFDETIGRVLDFARRDGNTLVVVTADHETGGFAINTQEEDNKDLNIAFTTKQHTATMVPVFAYGPGSHHFAGIYDNTEIHNKIKLAMDYQESN